MELADVSLPLDQYYHQNYFSKQLLVPCSHDFNCTGSSSFRKVVAVRMSSAITNFSEAISTNTDPRRRRASYGRQQTNSTTISRRHLRHFVHTTVSVLNRPLIAKQSTVRVRLWTAMSKTSRTWPVICSYICRSHTPMVIIGNLHKSNDRAKCHRPLMTVVDCTL